MVLLPGVSEQPVKDRILPERPTFDEKFWVAAAEGAVRGFCHWHVAPVREQTFALDGGGRRRILLPTMRLREVLTLTVDGRDYLDRATASQDGLLEIGEAFPCGLNSVIVRVSHGYAPEEVPEVQGVIASAAARFADSFGNIVASQAAGGSSVSFFPGAESLMAGERAKLEPYRLAGRA